MRGAGGGAPRAGRASPAARRRPRPARPAPPAAAPRPAGSERDGQVRAKLAMACRELDADTALLSEIRNGREHVRWGAGEAGDIGVSVPLSDTVCGRLLDGRIGNIVSDAALEASLNQLAGVTDG